MLVNHNPVTYAGVVAGQYVLGWVGLGCFIYFLLALFIGGVPAITHPFSIAVEAYGALEILWYLLWFLPFKAYLQRPGMRVTPTTRAQRKQLIEQLLDQVPDIKLFMRKWFNQAHLDEIYRDDVRDWLIWALWGQDNSEGIDEDELDEYISLAESKAEYTLDKGKGGAKPIRLNLDPVRMIHRSLLWYAMIGVMDHLGALMLIFNGFRFYRQPVSSFFKVFPFRLMTLLSFRKSASPLFSYMVRPHKSKKHRPIVFFHGIGIGLPTYAYWLSTIPKDIGVLAVEVLPVSGRISPEGVSARRFVKAMRAILEQQGYDDFVLIGHSYGTFLVRPLLDDPAINAKIDSIVVCDPVAIMLHLPDVAYNVTRRKPVTAPQVEIAWGAALDPCTAHTLCRRLHWPEHILFRENLVGKHTTVIVASRDCVLNADAVAGYVYYGDAGYITAADLEELRKTPELWTGRAELELIYLYDRDHGQSLLIPSEARKITHVATTYARNSLYDLEVQQAAGGYEPPVSAEKDAAAAAGVQSGESSEGGSWPPNSRSDSNMV